MAGNPFDKFDAPSNPFDKFDEGASTPGFLDRARAALTGVNRGAVAGLAGLPVDTAANVLDLLKAGVGYAGSKVTGHVPPAWTEPFDRSKIFGSGEYIAKQVRDGSSVIGVQSPMDNPNPQDGASRILYAGGNALGASFMPNKSAAISGMRTLGNAAVGGLSGLAAGVTNEVAPDYAGVVGMATPGATKAVTGATKYVLRGDEAGRLAMQQRMQDLRNGGVVNPSLGLSTGNSLVTGIENLLSKVPGSVGRYTDMSKANLAGMQGKVNDARDTASSNYGPAIAGTAIQNSLSSRDTGVTSFPNKITGNYNDMLNEIMGKVGADTRVPVVNTLATAGGLSTPNPLAPNASSLSISPKIKSVFNAFNADNGDTSGTNVLGLNVPGRPGNGIPFNVLKAQRTNIGEELNSQDVINTPLQGKYKQLYGGMSEDMANGVRMSDAANAGPQLPGMTAEALLNRSNNYYSAAADRMKLTQPFVNKLSPEQAYNSYVQAANGNVSTLQAVKKSIDPGTRGSVAATFLDNIGSANPGAQNSEGSMFSPDSFLTRYNKAGPGRNELLSGFQGSDSVRSTVDDVARAASMLKDGAKIWANPSGTAPNAAAGGALGGIASNIFSHPYVAAGGVAGLLGMNQLSKRVLLNPKFSEWASNPDIANPMTQQQDQIALQRALANMGLPGLLDN